MPRLDASITDLQSRFERDAATEFAADVRLGLTREGQKELPAKYLYDALGSALFEAITLLPEYGLTRADARLIQEHASDVAGYVEPSVVIELGSGSGGKARPILQKLAAAKPLLYCPIDLSGSALLKCSRELADIPNLEVRPLELSYMDGVQAAIRLRRPGTPILLLFLGSSIGNLSPSECSDFFRRIRNLLAEDDVFFLSTDLEKEEDRMLAAYDDAIGVTAAFNLNVLARINRELGGSFDLSRFEHSVRYDREERRVEMHLRSRVNHLVSIGPLSVGFRRGETLWTESSYKFRCPDVNILADSSGFRVEAQWVDREWPFAQTLMRAVNSSRLKTVI